MSHTHRVNSGSAVGAPLAVLPIIDATGNVYLFIHRDILIM